MTECVANNLNPDFKTTIKLGYSFEKHQQLKFEVLDDDGNNTYQVIGETELSMGKIMGSRAQTCTAELTFQGQGKRGSIIIRAEAVPSSKMFAFF